METIYANSTSVQGNTPAQALATGFSNMFSPKTDTATIMSNVADGLNSSVEEPSQEPSAPKSLAEAMMQEGITDINNTEQPNQEGIEPEDKKQKSGGRPKTDKNIAISYIAERANEGKLALFSDYTEETPIEEYLSKMPEKRLYELLDKNLEDVRNNARQEIEQTAAQSFYENLSPMFKAMYEYEVNGGTDWAVFVQNMQGYQSNQQLDPGNEEHQPIIARNYLEATGFGTPQMIQEQIQEWSNDGKLGGKVQQFKPILDNMYQQQAQHIAQQQQEYAKQQEAAAHEYITSVMNTLKAGELGGIKIDKKMQQDLYRGLTIADQESINGGYTNKLEHLWEKINYVDRDYGKIARLLWMMQDEEGYNNALMQRGKNEAADSTFNELKRLSVKNSGGSDIAETAGNSKKIRIMKPTLDGLWA